MPSESFDETHEKHLLYFLDVGMMEITWDEITIEAEIDEELQKVRNALTS